MKSKISVNIDSGLLGIIKDCSDSDLDSIIQEALAQFFGVKQIWVRSDTLDPIPVIPVEIDEKIPVTSKASIGENIPVVNNVPIDENLPVVNNVPIDENLPVVNNVPIDENIPVVKKKRKPRFVLKVWDQVKELLGPEFTTDDYWEATKKCNLNYKDSARHSTILDHLRLIEEAGKIVKMGHKAYRKVEIAKESLEPQVLESKLLGTGQPALKLFEDE